MQSFCCPCDLILLPSLQSYHHSDVDDLLDHVQAADVASQDALSLQALHGVQLTEARDKASLA